MIYIITSSMYVLRLLENNYIGLLNLDVAVHVLVEAGKLLQLVDHHTCM